MWCRKSVILFCFLMLFQMNFTRYMWQELYKCPIQHASVWPVTVASVVLCFLPVVFYIATKVFGHDVERTMVQRESLQISNSPTRTLLAFVIHNTCISWLIPCKDIFASRRLISLVSISQSVQGLISRCSIRSNLELVFWSVLWSGSKCIATAQSELNLK